MRLLDTGLPYRQPIAVFFPRGLSLLETGPLLLPEPPWCRQNRFLRYLTDAFGAIREDSSILLHTKTAYGTMLLVGGIALAAAFSPAESTIAERESTSMMAMFADTTAQPETESSSESSVTIELPAHVPVAPYSMRPVEKQARPWSQRGVFFTPNSIGDPTYRAYTMNRLRKVGGNAIIFDVKGSGVHFDAQNSPLAAELGLVNGTYNINEAVDVLHEHGVYAIARYIAVKDYSLAKKVPETTLTDPRNGSVLQPGWIDPDNELVLEYNRQIICELSQSGIDEINLDYIRFDTRDGRVMSAFSGEERIEMIEAFVKMARQAIDTCGPHTKLGLSTFAILGWDHDVNAAAIGQDIKRFAPMLDVISPMAYNANFSLEKYRDPEGKRGRWTYLVYQTVLGYRELVGPDHAWKVRPWIQAWGVTTDDVKNQVQGAFDAGACGFLAWNADNGYEPVYNAMKGIHVPENCRGIINIAQTNE